MYTQTEYQENGGYPCLLFYEGKDEEGALTGDSHLIPLQAIADRMELYGFESIEQTLEYLGLEFHNSEVSDTLHSSVQEAYGAVAQAEYAQTLMPAPVVGEVRQTLMAPMFIGQSRRTRLQECRGENLQVLGMQSMIHSEPGVRVMDASRPVERTRPAAAQALQSDEGVISEAVSLVQGHLEELQAWRLETVSSYVPHLRTFLEQMVES